MKIRQDLQLITENNLNVYLDLKYATNNNFTNKKIYKKKKCYLVKSAFEHLTLACEIAAKIGYKLKIFDAYRPQSAQKLLWEIFPNPNFISPPSRGSPHSRGVAVDLTLVDNKGYEIDMGTEFDEFSKLSFHGSKQISKIAFKNRLILLGIMTTAGWDYYKNEWWHYQLFDSKKFPLRNESL